MSNIFPSSITINSSSTSSTSSANPVNDLITKFDQTCIYSCVVGISLIRKIPGIDISHTALLLSNKKSRELRKTGGLGILIEYGDYEPSMCEDEKYKEKEGFVIYRYGDKGGLRYYAKDYKEFITEFGDIGYINLDLNEENQNTFSFLIEQLAPENENKWIKNNYNAIGIFSNPINCQIFVAHALEILRPEYDDRYIEKGIKTSNKVEIKSESIVPNPLLKVLHQLEK